METDKNNFAKFNEWLNQKDTSDNELLNNTDLTNELLGKLPTGLIKEVKSLAPYSFNRVKHMRNALRNSFAGFYKPEFGFISDWLLAAMIARENAVLLGPPGVAKTELAVRIFQYLDLKFSHFNEDSLKTHLDNKRNPLIWNKLRTEEEKKTQKYFHYLLSRYTQPEELFGPIEIDLLKMGILARINYGMLTGPGVKAAFLDEIFRGSSSILNTLLTLMQERMYFNWGAMEKSDLVFLIGASNELPGVFGEKRGGRKGAVGDEFGSLHAFLDRFTIRLRLENASGCDYGYNNEDEQISGQGKTIEESDLGKAFTIAMRLEGSRIAPLNEYDDGMTDRTGMPYINDLLLLSRCCFQHETNPAELKNESIFNENSLSKFKKAFLNIGRELQQQCTDLRNDLITWTISPRKIKALYKIALAHALVCTNEYPKTNVRINLLEKDLQVFNLIWDSEAAIPDLYEQARSFIKIYYQR